MKILLVDDQLLFLESLKIVIQNLASDMTVVGLAGNGREALEKVPELSPDLILMDVRMPELDGVAATKQIKGIDRNIKIIMLTTFEDDDYVKEALQNGAEGYMLKNIPPEMLLASIRAVMSGAVLISPNIASHLVENKRIPSKDKEVPHWFEELTAKEKNILKFLIKGNSNKEIAYSINVGQQTIRNYISTIYSKMEVSDRSGAIKKAKSLPSYLFN